MSKTASKRKAPTCNDDSETASKRKALACSDDISSDEELSPDPALEVDFEYYSDPKRAIKKLRVRDYPYEKLGRKSTYKDEKKRICGNLNRLPDKSYEQMLKSVTFAEVETGVERTKALRNMKPSTMFDFFRVFARMERWKEPEVDLLQVKKCYDENVPEYTKRLLRMLGSRVRRPDFAKLADEIIKPIVEKCVAIDGDGDTEENRKNVEREVLLNARCASHGTLNYEFGHLVSPAVEGEFMKLSTIQQDIVDAMASEIGLECTTSRCTCCEDRTWE